MINLKQFFRVLEEKEKSIYSFNGFKYNYGDISVLPLTKLFVYRVTSFNDKTYIFVCGKKDLESCIKYGYYSTPL